MTTTPAPIAHLYVLLDRSGSMTAIADDVIGGFNQLLADQQADGADARMTLVQFDSDDPEDVVADAVPVLEMLPLTGVTFVPRGGTPLLDATGRLVARASAHAAALAADGLAAEDITIVTVTDGAENASHELTLAQVSYMLPLLPVIMVAGSLSFDDISLEWMLAALPNLREIEAPT